jgi:riboflavin kinase/FMN adenylyltransferase
VQVHHSFESLPNLKFPVVTIGTFDGVHSGHKTILKHIQESAREHNGETVVLTFTPHPRTILFPEDHGISILTDTVEKRLQMEKCGIDHLIEFPFTRDFAKKSAFEYVRDLLAVGIGAKKVVIGYDHRFGRGREGNMKTLTELSQVFNFEVEEIPAVLIENNEISSSKIRHAIEVGDISFANNALEYSYALRGIVVHGDAKGRSIGFPTANLNVEDKLKLIPCNGVYAVEVIIQNKKRMGALNIGVRPTVSSLGIRTVEVHILDFEDDIYGMEIEVRFKKKIRNEMKFDSFLMLKNQLQKDIEFVRNIAK